MYLPSKLSSRNLSDARQYVCLEIIANIFASCKFANISNLRSERNINNLHGISIIHIKFYIHDYMHVSVLAILFKACTESSKLLLLKNSNAVSLISILKISIKTSRILRAKYFLESSK